MSIYSKAKQWLNIWDKLGESPSVLEAMTDTVRHEIRNRTQTADVAPMVQDMIDTVFDRRGGDLKVPPGVYPVYSLNVSDAAITSGLKVLTSATAAFNASSVGRNVVIMGAGAAYAVGIGGLPTNSYLYSRIVSVTNATTAVLRDAAAHTVSGAACTIGGIVPRAGVNMIGKGGQGCTIFNNINSGTPIFVHADNVGTGNLYSTVDYTRFSHLSYQGTLGLAHWQPEMGIYTANTDWDHCYFSAELSEGLYINPILCTVDHCVDGLFGTPGASHRAIYWSGKVVGNGANLNRIYNSRFYNATGGESLYIDGGYMFHMYGCNVEGNMGSHAMSLKGMYIAHIDHCYFERNKGTHQIALTQDAAGIQGLYSTRVSNTWIEMTGGSTFANTDPHYGPANTHFIEMTGATQNLDIEECGGVMGNQQFLTHYVTVGDDFGIKKYRGCRNWLWTGSGATSNGSTAGYTAPNIYSDLGNIDGSKITLSNTSAVNTVAGAMSVGLPLSPSTTLEVISPANSGIRLTTLQTLRTVLAATGATGSPVILAAFGHGLSTDDKVWVTNVNPAVDGIRFVTFIDSTHFSLQGTAAPITYSGSAGGVQKITVAAQMLASSGSYAGDIQLYDTSGNIIVELSGTASGFAIICKDSTHSRKFSVSTAGSVVIAGSLQLQAFSAKGILSTDNLGELVGQGTTTAGQVPTSDSTAAGWSWQTPAVGGAGAVTSVAGTANQVLVAPNTGAVQVSLPNTVQIGVAVQIAGAQIIGARQGGAGAMTNETTPNATDLASVILLANQLKARMTNNNAVYNNLKSRLGATGHGLTTDT